MWHLQLLHASDSADWSGKGTADDLMDVDDRPKGPPPSRTYR